MVWRERGRSRGRGWKEACTCATRPPPPRPLWWNWENIKDLKTTLFDFYHNSKSPRIFCRSGLYPIALVSIAFTSTHTSHTVTQMSAALSSMGATLCPTAMPHHSTAAPRRARVVNVR